MKKVERRFMASQIKTLGVGTHCDGGGLYLQCKLAKDEKSINRSWIFRFRLPNGGRLRDMGIGSASTLTLAEARDRARQLRIKLLDGIDPIEQRNASRAIVAPRVVTFDECATRYIEAMGTEWRSASHRDQWPASLGTWVSPIIGTMSVAAIDTPAVLSVLNQKFEDSTFWMKRTETASRVRGRIERILDWAKISGYRSGENPAAWRGHLDRVLPARDKIQKVEHHAALHPDDVAPFMSALREIEGSGPVQFAIQFIVLTAARVSEVTKAEWSEIDWAAKAWNVPADHTKRERLHRVPLTDAALKVLEQAAAIRTCDLIFPNPHTGRVNAPNTLLRVTKKLTPVKVTNHGFRGTFGTWAQDAGFDYMLIEAAIAHKRDKTTEAYQRGDRFKDRRKMMDAWAAHVMGETNVVQFKVSA